MLPGGIKINISENNNDPHLLKKDGDHYFAFILSITCMVRQKQKNYFSLGTSTVNGINFLDPIKLEKLNCNTVFSSLNFSILSSPLRLNTD